MILNKSGIKAGEEFFIDPLVILVGTLDGLDDGHEFPMATGFHDAQEGYVIADCVFPWWVLNLFTLPVMRIDRLGGHRKSLQLMIKVKDDLSGKITARGWVNKRITKDDRSRLRRGSELGKEILEHAGARNIYSCMTIAAHPGGSAKIGDVVDVNLKTRLKNLYVCDCSVIPTSWGRPPILTLVALGKRLGEHLAAQAN
jgi:choline dehydrogenase-like flavoprotein